MIDLKRVESEFLKYVDNYDSSNGRVRLKKEHILNVVKNCKMIAEQLGLSKEEVDLAQVIGYFHDIGRFEQVKRYNTFSDKDTGIDHAKLGLEVLYDDGLITKFLDDNTYDEIIKKSVFYHNKTLIDHGIKERELVFCKLIRDADKIDIYRTILAFDKEDCFWYKDFDGIDIDDELVEAVLKREKVDYKLIKNNADLTMTWFDYIFDINYRESFKIIRNNRYLEKLYEKCISIFNNRHIKDNLKKVLDECNNFIDEKIGFKVATFNICHGEGTDGIIDVHRQAKFIKDLNLDVCLLQELDNNTSRSGNIDEIKLISHESNLIYNFMGTNNEFDGKFYPNVIGGSYGNGIITKYPYIYENNYLTKVLDEHEKRGISHVKILVSDKKINLFSLHLSIYKEERINAIKELLDIIKNIDDEVIIVGGDFNIGIEKIGEHKYIYEDNNKEEYKLLESVLDRIGNTDITWYSKESNACIDTIFYSKNIKLIKYDTIKTELSDHSLVVATFEL